MPTRVALFLACLLFAAPVLAQEGRLSVTLEAPEALRPLLERHVRLLRTEQAVPERIADRIALIRRSRRDIGGLLATEGYFTPVIDFEREAPERWRIVVDPGPRATIAATDIRFEGHLAGDGEEAAARRERLRAAWTLQAGQPFRQSDWDAAKQSLLYEVSTRDYATARIAASRAEVDAEAALVRLSVSVDSGPPFRIGALEVRGIERLPADFVARYSNLREGEPFDRERLLALQGSLQNLPQLASVSVDIPRDPALADAVPVRVQVSEAESRRLSLGAGYSTNTGMRAELGWRDVNLFDRGWELETGLRLEQRRQSLFADIFLPPTRDNVRDSFGAMADASDIEGLRTDRYAIGAVRAWTFGDDETALSLRYQRERLRPDGADDATNKALTASVSWTRRRVDNPLDPRSGYVLRGEIGGGAKSLLSDQDFLRLYARAAHYLPVGNDTLILRGELGATLADSRDGIPLDYLFRTGGSQSVRGYDYESLGVKEGDATLGGRYLATASAEYIHWFRPQWGVASFIDIGDAADSRRDFDAKVGIGVGARWRSPAGPIALDLAYGHDDQRFRLHFSVAIAF
ncbi:MAG: autotransporter assembly complex protein TamA [Pseudazoarcus pumilus]|nr:autotransporter assembly complex protein TamA [Pseudazoarcus pumilus]